MSSCTSSPFSLLASFISNLVQKGGNRTLAGHKLLLLTPWELGQERVASLQRQFPDLKVETTVQSWDTISFNDSPVEVCWDDITMLVTGSCVPAKDKAPRLQYVQLLSAGVNFLLENSLFKSSAITFCTANGVHG